MEVVFLGYAVNEKDANVLSGASIAGNKMQLNILKELSNYEDINLKIITVYPVAVYPHDKHFFYAKREIPVSGEMKATRIGFINIPLIKQFMQIVNVERCAKWYLKENKNAVILTFNMYPQIGNPAVSLKRKFGNNIVAILADLPIDDNYQRRGLGKWIMSRLNAATEKNIRNIDKAVTLNKKAMEIYAPDKEYIVVEGGISKDDIEKFANASCYEWNDNKKHIIYAGSLNEYSGIKELAEAVCEAGNRCKDVVLDIYGNGNLRSYIESKNTPYINYHGTVSNEELLPIMKSAWLLANPRPVDDKIAQVTFPSKIFEYMASGTPILSTRLSGFTQEYLDNMYVIEDNSKENIQAKLIELYNMDQSALKEKGASAKQFVITQKNWHEQVKKIENFIKQ